jgi:hypothetical protein
MSSNENNANWRFENKKDSNQITFQIGDFITNLLMQIPWLRPYKRLRIMWSGYKTKMN